MAEKTNDMALVINGNYLKQRCIEIKSDLSFLIKNMETSKEKKTNYDDIRSWNLSSLFVFLF